MAEYVLRVNGRDHRVQGEAGDSLLTVLRDDLGLAGSKFGCGEGYCGACTVLLDGQTTRSCVTRLGTVGARPITTIEGAGTPGRLHPVQQAFIDAEAFQCGYCTPGMLLTSYVLLKHNAAPSEADIREGLAGNLCRCTGYQNIVKSVQQAAGTLVQPAAV